MNNNIYKNKAMMRKVCNILFLQRALFAEMGYIHILQKMVFERRTENIVYV